MKQNQAIKQACRVLRRKVRFKSSALVLPGHHWTSNDTPMIQEATWTYVETWIVPIIDMIEKGDTKALDKFTAGDPGDDIGSEP